MLLADKLLLSIGTSVWGSHSTFQRVDINGVNQGLGTDMALMGQIGATWSLTRRLSASLALSTNLVKATYSGGSPFHYSALDVRPGVQYYLADWVSLHGQYAFSALSLSNGGSLPSATQQQISVGASARF